MLGIPIEHFVPIAQFLGAALVGLLAIYGIRYGQRTPTPAEKSVEIAGALVDSQSVKDLAIAIEKHTAECAAMRQDGERARRLGHELVEAVGELTKELTEIRSEMRIKRRWRHASIPRFLHCIAPVTLTGCGRLFVR
jgi:hypothetical protein